MSVNDVSACGAVPLFFLDYLVVGKLVPEQVAELVAGVDEGCLRAQCVLLGGETAEHPGHFAHDGDFDMAGFAVGMAERDELWGPAKVRQGDVLSASASSGVHANGFSLIRAILRERSLDLRPARSRAPARRWATCCSRPPPSTAPCCTTWVTPCGVHAAAHVTGGGFPDNVGRAVPDDLAAEVDLDSWELPGRLHLAARARRGRPGDAQARSTAASAWS